MDKSIALCVKIYPNPKKLKILYCPIKYCLLHVGSVGKWTNRQKSKKEDAKIFPALHATGIRCRSGLVPVLLLTLFGLSSHFSWVHPNIPPESPNKVRTTSEQRPVQYPPDTGTIPKKHGGFCQAFSMLNGIRLAKSVNYRLSLV